MHELPVPNAPRRVFTALFPDPAACAAIDAARQRWRGLPHRLHPAQERMHLTLQFFSRLSADRERGWIEALASLRFDAFEVALTHAELWDAPSGSIVVLRPAPNAALEALHEATARLARLAGLPAAAGAWKPHVTTLRRADGVLLAPLNEPIGWTVHHVDLIWSEVRPPPPRYHRLGQFPSEGGDP